ncbi:xanthine dehydrogenase family protein molybdopterin-binding subunit [Chloroflexota bacterium]
MSEVKEYTYIGKRIPRIDALPKVTGEVTYFGDVRPPRGTLVMKVLYSPYAHARILSIDTSKAEQLPGVRAVVTSKDMPKTALDFYMFRGRGRSDNFPMATDKARFVGDEVAAVAADNEDIAEEALKLIDVKYEVLDAVYDPKEAMKPGAPTVYDDIERNIAASQIGQHGDVEKGFKEADYIFEDEFQTQPHYHAIMERSGCMCSWDTGGNLTMWTPSQSPHLLQWIVGVVLEMPIAKVRVICPYIGGGFGAKSHVMFPYVAICAVLAKKACRPVKVEFSRGEDFAWGGVAPAFNIRLKTGVKKDGTIIAREARFIADCGGHVYSAGGNMWLAIHFSTLHLYKIPNFKYEGHVVYTNNPVRTLAFRGFGNTQGTWAAESQMDMIADKMGMDPMELRLKNLFEPGEISAEGWKFDAYGLPDCIKQATEAANWNQKRKEKVPNRGIGMACLILWTGVKGVIGPVELSSIIIMAKEDGSFIAYTDQMEIGAGIWTVIQQVAAEIIGTRLEDIRVVGGDTEFTPFDQGSYASRACYHTGNAAKLAAFDMRQQLFEIAAPMLEASVDDLDAGDGQIFVKKSPDKKVSIAEVTNHAHLVQGTVLISKGIFNAPTGVFDQKTSSWPPPGISTSYPFACQIAEVEVDPKTGKVKVLNLTAAHDVGYPINLNTVEGQIEGGIHMGLGYGLSENLNHEQGRVLVTDFSDYLLWRAPDMPKIKPIVVTTDDKYGPFGAKGLGESVFVPTAPAIASAVYNAIGVRIKDIPLTPEKVLKALKEKS